MFAKKLLSRLALKLLRSTSSEWRAYTDLMVSPYDRWVEWVSGLGPAVHVLHGLVRASRPEVVVEIGSARGRSTCALALACRLNGKGKVYAIDPHNLNSWTHTGTGMDNGGFLRGRLAAYELTPWCEVLQMGSAEAAADWSRMIDFLFVDGDHTYEGVRRDFELFRPFLTDKALVAFHDSLWEYQKGEAAYRPDIGVPRYLQELREAGYHSVTVPVLNGLTVLYPKAGGFQFLPGVEEVLSSHRSGTTPAATCCK
jgi:predicted O-methyltransferase YrrM